MSERYLARRAAESWQVTDTQTGEALECFPASPAGAAAASASAAALNAGRERAPHTELRAWRRAHGLTQTQLAQRLGIAWLTYQRWESGYAGAPPYLSLLLKGLESEL